MFGCQSFGVLFSFGRIRDRFMSFDDSRFQFFADRFFAVTFDWNLLQAVQQLLRVCPGGASDLLVVARIGSDFQQLEKVG